MALFNIFYPRLLLFYSVFMLYSHIKLPKTRALFDVLEKGTLLEFLIHKYITIVIDYESFITQCVKKQAICVIAYKSQVSKSSTP